MFSSPSSCSSSSTPSSAARSRVSPATFAFPTRSTFLQADPLIAISNALSTHALYRRLIWCLVILIPTLFLGRFFCGWICPLGSMNHFFSNFKSERKRGLQRIESNRYKKWQTLKYYILVALLVSAVFGGLIVGVMDPDFPDGALAGAVGSAGNQLRAQRVPGCALQLEVGRPATRVGCPSIHFAGDDSGLQTAILPPGLLPGAPVHRHHGVELPHHALLVPGALPAGRAAGFHITLDDLRHGEAHREVSGLQPVRAALPGR